MVIKEKAFCKGSPDLARVLKLIKDKGITVRGEEDYWNDSRYTFAYSIRNDGAVGFSFDSSCYPSKGYEEVTPGKFSVLWLGYDCLYECEKSNSYCVGCPDLAKVIDRILKENPNIRIMADRGCWNMARYHFAQSAVNGPGEIGYSSNFGWFPSHGYHEVDAHVFSRLWLGYDCLTDTYHCDLEEIPNPELEKEVPEPKSEKFYVSVSVKSNIKIML